MPRVTTVKRAQKDQGTCGRCSKPLAKGDGYRWWAFRYGGKRKRCLDAACAPRSSDLTQSKMSTAYAAQEALEDWLGGWEGTDLDEVQSECDCAADEIEAVADEYQESADSIRDTFSESETADDCEDKAEQLRAWAEEIRDAAQNAEAFEGNEDDDDDEDDDEEEPETSCDACAATMINGVFCHEQGCPNKAAADKAAASKTDDDDDAPDPDDWRNDITSEIETALGNCPF